MSEQKVLSQFRPEVDGLRAVAIIPVLLFHAGINAFAGGFFGVDVFFVISGYLITMQLATSEKTGLQLLRNFYHRRIRRLFPAIAVVSLSTALIAFLIMTPSQLKPFFSSFTATQVFFQNFYLWQNSGYWDQSLETSPLMHTWSLAVEEQFYFLFPFLFVFTKIRRSTNALTTIAGAVFIISFFAAITRLGTSSIGAFFLLPYRAWELMAGALVALYEFKRLGQSQTRQHLQKAATNLGLVLILVSIVVGDKNTYHPGFMTLLPVVGTSLVIAFGRQSSVTSKILSKRLFTDIGKLSYGLYLWHFPILAIWRVKKGTELANPEVFVAMLATFVLAYLMWRFAETPFRDFVRTKTRTVALVASIGFVALVTIGVAGQQTAFGKTSSKELALLEAQAEVPEFRDNCEEVDFEAPISGCIIGSNQLVGSMGEVVLLGDSHAGALKDSLSSKLLERNVSGMSFVKAGCPPVSDIIMDPVEKFNCTEFNQIIDLVLGESKITDVILFARWTFYIEGTRFTNFKGYREEGYEVEFTAPNTSFKSTEERINYLGDQVKLTIERLESTGKRVHLVYPLPELGWDPITYAKVFIDRGESWHRKLDIPYEDFLARTQRTFGELDRATSNLTNAVFASDLVCNNQISDWCVASSENTLYYGDNDHLNKNGNKLLAEFIVGRVLGER